MKLITCCSFQGGAGKTTALLGLCSALAARNNTVALFEGDENRPPFAAVCNRWGIRHAPIPGNGIPKVLRFELMIERGPFGTATSIRKGSAA